MARTDLEQLFDVSLDLLCIAGFDGYFKRVNPAFERTLGYTTEELVSRPFLEFIHPDDRDRTAAAMETLGRGTDVVQFENRYVRTDGSVRWLQWNTRPAPDKRLVYAAARDVTERRLLTEEQAALRRVAVRVAQGDTPHEVFHAVGAEIERLTGADSGVILRYEPDGTATVVAQHPTFGPGLAVGTRVTLEGDNVSGRVRRNGRPARMDSYEHAAGWLAGELRKRDIHTVVGAPIIVAGRLWGVMNAVWSRTPQASLDLEDRLMQFSELVGTAIANADSRAELIASRARVVAEADETRRRIERELHDGTQRRLLSLALGLRAAEEKVPAELPELRADLHRIATGLAGAVEELQEISRGLHPAILSRGGLAPALRTLARRAALPVELSVHADRDLPEQIEVAAYYVVSEAITNAAKHAQASVVRVDLRARDSTVTIAIRDDGIGGADPTRGSGLIGLHDRVEAVGGTLDVASAHGHGTSLEVMIPVGGI